MQPAKVSKSDWLESLAGRILGYWSSPLFEDKLVASSLVTLLIGACVLRGYLGMNGLRVYTHDVFVFLDGGWRILNGQRSNIDFFSDHGPIMYAATALGIKWAGGVAAGLGWIEGVIGCLLGIWALLLTARRLDAVGRALFCILIVLVAISPYTPGEPFVLTTPATVYNRYGYCLIALAMLECALDSRGNRAKSEVRGGFSTGIIAAILLFLKISYFLWIGALAMLLIPCRVQTRRRWIGMAAGFVAGLLPFLVYFRGSLLPMIADLRTVAGAKHIQWRWYLVEGSYFSFAPLVLFILTATALVWAEGSRRTSVQVAVAGAATFLGSGFLLLTNNQKNELPLAAMGAVLILHLVNSRPSVETTIWMRSVVTLWGAWFIMVTIALNYCGLLFGVFDRAWAMGDARSHFHSPYASGLTSFDVDYVNFVNDGLDLIRRNRRAGDTIMSLDFSNPFSFLLATPPARGGTTGLQFNTNFSDAHHPAPEWLIGHATLVIVPEVYSDGSLDDNIPRIYGPYLTGHYHQIERSARWKLYRRNE